jgi:hypothetical protein
MAAVDGRRYDREVEPDRPWSLEALVAETRADVRGLRSDVDELKVDVRRLDDRLFQLLLLQVGTLLAALGSIVAAALS